MVNVVRGFVGLITQIITSTTGLFLLNLGYLLFGSYVFYVLESPFEAQLVSDLAEKRSQLIHQLDNLEKATKTAPSDATTSKDGNIDIKKNASILLADYEQKLADFYRKRAVLNINDESGSNATGQTKLWTPLGAIIYSYSVITTIGWGNIVPGTDNGKMVTIIYGIFGIPLLFALSTDTGNMVAAFNLKLWKLIHGIFTITSRMLGFKKIDKADDDGSDSDDDNDNRKRDESGSNANPLFEWDFPVRREDMSVAEILERVKIQQKITQRILDVSIDVRCKTTYLRTTESTVNFLLDLALKRPARDLESVLPATLPHKRILCQEDALQLVHEFDSMCFSELKLCMELVGVKWEMFHELLGEGDPGSWGDSTTRPAKLIEPQQDSPMITIVTLGPETGAALEIFDSTVKLCLSGDGAAIGELSERGDFATHQFFNISEDVNTIQAMKEKSEIVCSHVKTGDAEDNILAPTDNPNLDTVRKSKAINSEGIWHGIKTSEDLCEDHRAKLLPDNERVLSKEAVNETSVTLNEDTNLAKLQTRENNVELTDYVIGTSACLSARSGVNENGGAEPEFIDSKTKKLALLFSKVFEVEKQKLVPNVRDSDATKPQNKTERLSRRVEKKKKKRKAKIERYFWDGRGAPECSSSSVESRGYTKEGPASRSSDVGGHRLTDSGSRYSRVATLLDKTGSMHSLTGSLMVEVGSGIADGQVGRTSDNYGGDRKHNGGKKTRKIFYQNRERSAENSSIIHNNGRRVLNDQELDKSRRRCPNGSCKKNTLNDTATSGSVDAITSNPTYINRHGGSYRTAGLNRIEAVARSRRVAARGRRSNTRSTVYVDEIGVTPEGDSEKFQVDARSSNDVFGEVTREDGARNRAAGDSNLSVKQGVDNLNEGCPLPPICIELARTGGDLEFRELAGELTQSELKSRKNNGRKMSSKSRQPRDISTDRFKLFNFSSLHARMSPYAVKTKENFWEHVGDPVQWIRCVKEKVQSSEKPEVDVNQSADRNVNFRDLFGDPDEDEISYSVSENDERLSDYSDRGDSDEDGKGEQKGEDSHLPLSVLYLFVIIYILLGSLIYFNFTKESENKFLNWVYFIYVTLSTTGFGDILPEEHMLLFTAVYGLLGMAIFNILLNATLETFLYAIDYINAFNVGEEEDDASDES